MQETSRSFVPVTSFLLGIAAGSIAAVLLAPYAGAETRRRLKTGLAGGKTRLSDNAEALKRRSGQVVNDLVAQGETLVEMGKKKVAEEARRIDSALQAGKAAYRGSAAQA